MHKWKIYINFIATFLLLSVVMSVVFRKEMFTVSALALLAGAGYIFLLYIASDKTEFFDEIYGYCLAVFLICVGIFQISNMNNLRYVPSFDMDAIFGEPFNGWKKVLFLIIMTTMTGFQTIWVECVPCMFFFVWEGFSRMTTF